jgi:centromere-localized protein 2
MAPTESTILTNYLLVPAPLPGIMSLKQFEGRFPKSLRSTPQVRALYRDLQQQRNATIESVAANIAAEIKRGKEMKADVAMARRQAEAEEPDDEMEVERVVCFASTLPFLQRIPSRL